MSSPQVTIKEKVFETPQLPSAGFTAVVLLTANKGNFETINLIGSTNSYQEIYGTDTGRSFGLFTAKKFWTYSSNLYIGRAGIQNSENYSDSEAKKSSADIEDIETSGQVLGTLTALTEGDDGDNIDVKFTKLEEVSGEPINYTVDVLYDEDVVETYKNVNFDENSESFIEDALANSGIVSLDVNDSLVDPKVTDTNVTISLTGGKNGDVENDDGELIDSYVRMIEELKDKDKYRFDVIVVPDYGFHPEIITALDSLVANRNDCVALIDAPIEIGISSTNATKTSNAVDFTDGAYTDGAGSKNLNQKNLFHFAYWLKDYDSTANAFKWFPPSIYILAKFAEITVNEQAWQSIAGFQNGRINISEVQFSPAKEYRDILYGEQLNGKINVVNPIINDNADGIMLWGQRSTERSNKPTNRINVVMMLNYLKQNLYRIGKRHQFRINGKDTLWDSFEEEVNNVLKFLVDTNGIDKGEIVDPAKTNTPTVIANNKALFKVKVTPSAIAEDIEIVIEATPQNVTVSEA